MNMFTGVVVESFAYVYQRPGGVSINREDISEHVHQRVANSYLRARGFQESLGVYRYGAHWLHQAQRLYPVLLGRSSALNRHMRG